MGAGRVVDRDKGYDAMLKRIAAATDARAITVGVHEEEGGGAEPGGLTVADVAAINEFGGGDNNPPARSFIAAWADDYESTHRQNLTKLGQALVKGTVANVQKGLDQLALLYEGLVKARIQGGIDPPNAESTIKRKGSSKPLIGITAQLIGSIRGKVEGGK